jgi:hypothetical protein
MAVVAAMAAADQAAAFAPTAGSLRLRAPATQATCQSAAPTRATSNVATSVKMSGMAAKYGHLRGAEIEPAGDAVNRFYKLFGKPVYLSFFVLECASA